MPRVTDLIRNKIEIDSGITKKDFNHLNEWEKRQGYNPTGVALKWSRYNDLIRNSSSSTEEYFRRTRKEGD